MYKKYFVILHLPNNKGVRQTMRKYLKWLLPVIFIAYYSCITLFIHVHIEHGTTIVHSHPSTCFTQVKNVFDQGQKIRRTVCL